MADPTTILAPGVAELGLGDVYQISFVVADMDVALPVYEAMFGPFTRRDVVISPQTSALRGEPMGAELSLAFGSSAGVEIELVQVRSGETPHSQHLRAHGEGLHHVAFKVPAFDATIADLRTKGFSEAWRGVSTKGNRFVYLEAPHLAPSMIELFEV